MNKYFERQSLKGERENQMIAFFKANPDKVFTVKETRKICFNNDVPLKTLNDILHAHELLESEKQLRWVTNGRKSMYVFRLKKNDR